MLWGRGGDEGDDEVIDLFSFSLFGFPSIVTEFRDIKRLILGIRDMDGLALGGYFARLQDCKTAELSRVATRQVAM